MDVNQKYEFITRNLREMIVDEFAIKKIMAKRPLRIYWGTAPTGRIHIGYLLQVLKIIDYLQAECDVIIFIADLHATFDTGMGGDIIEARTEYYIKMIEAMLAAFTPYVEVDTSRVRFVRGTEFQLDPEYTKKMYMGHTLLTVSEAKDAGCEVVGQCVNPKMSSLLYPTLQALDEEYLKVDVESGGIDQKKIFAHARSIMPKLGFGVRSYFMTSMVCGLRWEKKVVRSVEDGEEVKRGIRAAIMAELEKDGDGEGVREFCDRIRGVIDCEDNVEEIKMSSMNDDTKVDMLDGKEALREKINKVHCIEGDVDDNCLLELVRDVIFPMFEVMGIGLVVVESDGVSIYHNYGEVREAFECGRISVEGLRESMVEALNVIIRPIRREFKSAEMRELMRRAYG